MTATHNLNRLCFLELKNTYFEQIEHSFLYKNVVFPAQAEISYFSVDFRLTIFLILNNSLWLFRFRMSWGFN